LFDAVLEHRKVLRQQPIYHPPGISVLDRDWHSHEVHVSNDGENLIAAIGIRGWRWRRASLGHGFDIRSGYRGLIGSRTVVTRCVLVGRWCLIRRWLTRRCGRGCCGRREGLRWLRGRRSVRNTLLGLLLGNREHRAQDHNRQERSRLIPFASQALHPPSYLDGRGKFLQIRCPDGSDWCI